MVKGYYKYISNNNLDKLVETETLNALLIAAIVCVLLITVFGWQDSWLSCPDNLKRAEIFYRYVFKCFS